MITVSYSGVHQAYQIAKAAQDVGLLDAFWCSLYNATGCWGGRLSRLVGSDAMRSRGLSGLDSSKIIEYPWPEMAYKLAGRLVRLPDNTWIKVAQNFDRWAAKQLSNCGSQVFIGVENCASESFQVAKSSGMRLVYDCPGVNAGILKQSSEEAARLTGLRSVAAADTPETTRRKEKELGLADIILTYSDFHTKGVLSLGVSSEKIVQIPLWTDTDFWSPANKPIQQNGPLRVLFVGGINLRKGVPFLVEAVRSLYPYVHLTLVGNLDLSLKVCFTGCEKFVNVRSPVAKNALRDIYRSNDVLVLPSLGDSFGFVAMEAMACGLPVIITENCGAPVPNERWRVPVMDVNSIAENLSVYLDDRDLLATHSKLAQDFACEFTAEKYRHSLQKIFFGFKR